MKAFIQAWRVAQLHKKEHKLLLYRRKLKQDRLDLKQRALKAKADHEAVQEQINTYQATGQIISPESLTVKVDRGNV